MTERQKEIMEAYLEMVGDEKFSSEEKDFSPAYYPVLRNDTPRLKPDRKPYDGIVPRFANFQLPAIEYHNIGK